tara:strand:- start:21387 stop:21641 length:255 start_codon:yes stop_codon:yes gene_type:complete
MHFEMPSKFTVGLQATDEEVWEKILETLPNKERNEVDRSKSETKEPYLGGKQILVKRTDYSEIAFASISEIKEDLIEWAVYKEA